MRAWARSVRACMHGPRACMHACVHGPGAYVHGDPSGTDRVCEDSVGTHMGVRGSSGHAHGHAGIQWAHTQACGNPVGTDKGV